LTHVAVCGFLARHTEADSGHRLAARLRNLRAAFLTVRQPGPARQPALSALHCIAHGRIDLILYGSVARPACRHRRTMPIRISSTNEAHHRVCAASRKKVQPQGTPLIYSASAIARRSQRRAFQAFPWPEPWSIRASLSAVTLSSAESADRR